MGNVDHPCLQPLGNVLAFRNGKSIKPGGAGEYPVYGSNGIIGGCDEYREENGVILGRVGAYCGSVAYCPGRFWASDNTIVAYPKSADFDILYISYLLRNTDLHRWAGGAAQPLLTQTVLSQVEVAVPPLSTQRKIAAILSAYDDLIENNLRRIKILEEMAQALYREWFVKFRFPGHEHARFVDSPLGRIPEGWEVVAFTDIADVCSGGTPRTTVPEYWDGPIPFFAPKDAPESFYVTTTEKTITEEGLRRCNSRLYPKDTVFITARGTVGKVVMPSVDMAMNQSCYALRGRPGVGQLYLFMATREQVNYLKKNTGGATFDTIVVDTFRRMSVVRPTDDAIATFVELAEPIAEHILITVTESAILRRTRDLLLPKLISGEMDVSELDIAVPEEAMGA